MLGLVACQGSLEGSFPARTGAGSGGQGTGGSGTGGSGTGGSGSGGSSGGCDAVAMVLKPSCATLGCHQGGTFDPFPNLAATDVGAMVKGMKAMSRCKGDALADPSNPMQSVLYKVIAGTACEVQMPLGFPFEGDQLTSSLACMADWIAHL